MTEIAYRYILQAMTAEQKVGTRSICKGCIWQTRDRFGPFALKAEVESLVSFGGEQDLTNPYCRAARVIFNSWVDPKDSGPFMTHDTPVLSVRQGALECNRYWPTVTQIGREVRGVVGRTMQSIKVR